jgi:Zn-dependent alcohol dehydrogenase
MARDVAKPNDAYAQVLSGRFVEVMMKAAVLRTIGRPMTLENLDLQSPQAGEVRVKVLAAGVCHSDLHYMTGDLICPLPVVLGHEGAGVVEEVGPGVTRVRPGDLVVMMWRPRCGHCEFCAAGRPALCTSAKIQVRSGGLLDGTSRLSAGKEQVHHFLGVSCFAEQAVLAQESVIKIPDGTRPEVAALVGCAVVTGVGAVLNVMGAGAGQRVLVIGAGGVGLSAVIGARLVGADPIIVADVAPEKLALAAALGATHTIDTTARPLQEALDDICPDGIDWAFEAVGKAETVQAAMASLRPGGTTVAIGLGRAGATVAIPLNDLVQRDKRLIGSLYGSSNTLTQVPRLLELYATGRLPLDKLLGRSYALDEINEAYRDLVGGAVGRAVILPGSDR